MLGVAIFGVFFLRGMIQSAQNAEMSAFASNSDSVRRMAEQSQGDENDEDNEGGEFANSLRGRFHASGRSLRDELTELVRDDPDAAANVLQNWITEAA
jgi:flagellar biosynthesis/type III secretory pathway M-ring protein FliF/YscJ